MSGYSINDIEKIFLFSEDPNNGGFFPLGKNSLWHGGIHLPYYVSNDTVEPLVSGKIISYRLDKSELLCAFPEKLSPSILEEYNIKTKVDNEEITLKACYDGKKIKDKYRNKKFTIGSGNYILLKKDIKLNDDSTLVFYMLYMHLLPVEKYLLENKDCVYKKKADEKKQIIFSNINKDLKTPFYIKWKCEVLEKFSHDVYMLKVGEKQIPPHYSVELNQPDFFKKDFSLNENTLLNLKHGDFEFETKFKNLTLRGDVQLKTEKDKIYLLKSISDLNSYKPPVFTTNQKLIYTYQENNQENSKFRKVKLNLAHNGNKETQDSRKIYHSGFVPKENISENDKDKKKFVNKSCYLRYPDLTITPPDDLFIINQDGEKNEIWVNKKYALYPQGANETEIFLPSETVVLTITDKDKNDNSFLQVKITEMCIFVSEDDLEQDTNDSNKYKVKEKPNDPKKLNHPIYIVDDKKQKFKNQLRFSFEQDETVTNEKRKAMKRLIFGEKGEFLLNKVFSASSENVEEYTEENIEEIKYRRLVYHSDAAFWIREDAFGKRLELTGEKLDTVLNYENNTIKTKLKWGKIKNKGDYDDYLSLKIYEHPFEPMEYYFYTQNKDLPVIKRDFSALKDIKYSKSSDLEKLGVKIYCMKTSQFLFKGTNVEMFDIANISYEKDLKLKYIDTWEELSKGDVSAIVQLPSIDEGLFFINEDDLEISKSKSGAVIEVQEKTDDFELIKNCFIKCLSKNIEGAESIMTYEDIKNLDLVTCPDISNNFIELQTKEETIHLYCSENQVEDNLLVSNSFNDSDWKEHEVLPSDCLGFPGKFLNQKDFIHLSLFSKEKISELKFRYFLLKNNLGYKTATLHKREEVNIKKIYLPTNEVCFKILNKISENYTGPLCVKLISMYVYIHKDDFHLKEPTYWFEEKWREYFANEKFKHPIYLYDKANKIDFNDSKNTIEKLKNLCTDFFDNGSVIYNKKLQKIHVTKNLYPDPDNQNYFKFKITNQNGPIYYIYKNEVDEDITSQKKNTGTNTKWEITNDCKYLKIYHTKNLLWIRVSDNIDYTTLEDISLSDDEVDFPVFKRSFVSETVYTIPPYFNEYKRWGAEIPITEENLYKFSLEKKVNNTIQTVQVYVKKGEVYESANLKLEDFFNVQTTDDSKDLKCDIQKDIIEKLNAQKDQGLENIKRIEQIYTGTDEYKSAREELRRMVCKFPFEWNKEFYDPNKYKYMTDIAKNIMDSADISARINSIEELKDEKFFYHFNPAYFLKKLDEWGLFEFNPYMVVADTLKTSVTNNIKIISNPGFVPYEEKYKTTDGYSTNISQEFNKKGSGDYYHEGVDIPVKWKEGIPIKALINGQVVYSNDQSDWTYGRFIVIRANNKYQGFNIYYLLAHLDRNKEIVKVPTYVFPGMTVGYVGNTGHCTSGDIDMNGPGYDKQRATGRGRHLHLEVFKTKSEDFESSFITDISKKNKDKKVEVKYRDAPIVNPFNFEEPYKLGKQE